MELAKKNNPKHCTFVVRQIISLLSEDFEGSWRPF